MNNAHSTLNSTISEAIIEMNRNGYDLNSIEPDEKYHRFGPKNAQWYFAKLLFTKISQKPILFLIYGDWRTGEKTKYRSTINNLSLADQADLEIQRQKAGEEAELARKRIQDQTAIECQRKWDTLATNGSSPYLERKLIPRISGVRYQDQTLYIPCYNIEGRLRTLQTIQPKGDKFFYPGGEVIGCFYTISNLDSSDILLLCEGYATGASLHLATGYPVIVAFYAGNLIDVALAIRNKYPDKKILICGDDDRWATILNGRKPANVGMKKAKKAAKLINSSTVFLLFKILKVNLPTLITYIVKKD